MILYGILYYNLDMCKSYYNAPVGVLEIICEKDTLISLKLVKNIEKTEKETAFIKTIKSQLKEYSLGQRKIFNIALNPKGTEFQKLVWQELQKIPYGKTKSYSEIAYAIGKPNAQRAVGSTCNKNPIMIIIPCHRVLPKNGNIGGFAYGNLIKHKLLELENRTRNNSPLFI